MHMGSPRLTSLVCTVALPAMMFLPNRATSQQPAMPTSLAEPQSLPASSPIEQTTAAAKHEVFFRELDLLRRNDFEKAEHANVSVRVVDKHGNRVPVSDPAAFQIAVNGSIRKAHLVKQPGASASSNPPLVMLVFPPNQPTIHYLAVQQCLRYFANASGSGATTLPWKVGIIDANGTFLSFTNDRATLLQNLEAIRTTKQTISVANFNLTPRGQAWDGGWLNKANIAISEMQRLPGARLILAMNPLPEPTYRDAAPVRGADIILANDGPLQLMPIAQQIGAQMYIANVGGPEPILPGGDAAGLGGLVHYVPNMQQLNGTLPSGNQVIPQAQTAALAQAAAQTSQMMQIADATLGGFSNSIATLATQMQQDIDGATVLQFDMTPEDQDIGVPQVEVGLKQPALHAAILDIEPVLSVQNSEQNRASQKTAHDVLAGMSRPVSSPDFAIAQHVDYFPGHSGLEAVLPMSCLITWTGHGPRPTKIFIVESVIDKDLSTTVLERQLDSTWEARSVFWERDGLLRPGNYAWRIAVADAQGRILASAQRDIRVTYPRQPAVSVSSLVLSKSCDLQQPASGLLHRSTAAQKKIEPLQFKVDPLQLTSCRIKPEPTDSYAATDTLHALVRIYPNGKTEKNRPENWTATFLLRSNAGSIESQQQIPFTIDSQSGLLASAVLPLTGILAGTHSLDVELRGPGLRKPVTESRQVLVQPAFE